MVCQLNGIVAQENSADAPPTLGDQDRSYRGLSNRKTDRGLIRLAAFAGPESRFLRFLGRRVRSNTLQSGGARRTGRTAVHTRSPDRVNEVTVRLSLAGNNGRPTRVILDCGGKFSILGRYIHKASLVV